jgi:hypothetical protein
MSATRSSAKARKAGYTPMLVAELLFGVVIYAVVQAGFRLICLWERLTARRPPPDKPAPSTDH